MKNNGFTLVELIATITILGIIASITIYSVLNIVEIVRNRSYKVTITLPEEPNYAGAKAEAEFTIDQATLYSLRLSAGSMTRQNEKSDM